MINVKRSAGAAVILSGLGLAFFVACSPNVTPIEDSPGGEAGTSTAAAGNAGSAAIDDAAAGVSGAGGDTAPDDATTNLIESAVSPDAATMDAAVTYTDSPFMIIDSSFVPDESSVDPPIEAGRLDAGEASAPAAYYVRCTATLTKEPSCVAPDEQCCYDSDAPAAGRCQSSRIACPAGAGTYTCDGPEDCGVGEVCCASVSTKVVIVRDGPHNEYSTACRAANACPGRVGQVGIALNPECHLAVAGNCAAGTTCQAVANMPYGYGLCLQ